MNEIDHLIAAYEALMMLPSSSMFRVKNQHVYATLRDAIALTTSHDPEFIQTSFENLAFIKRLV